MSTETPNHNHDHVLPRIAVGGGRVVTLKILSIGGRESTCYIRTRMWSHVITLPLNAWTKLVLHRLLSVVLIVIGFLYCPVYRAHLY